MKVNQAVLAGNFVNHPKHGVESSLIKPNKKTATGA
jgi:hypothetical protein